MEATPINVKTTAGVLANRALSEGTSEAKQIDQYVAILSEVGRELLYRELRECDYRLPLFYHGEEMTLTELETAFLKGALRQEAHASSSTPASSSA